MPPTSITRSIPTVRRDQIHAMDNGQDLSSEPFQRHVADLFTSLITTTNTSDFLSLSWIEKLLQSFLLIQEEFRSILLENRSLLLTKSPLERIVTDYFDRSVKALDVCNAIRDGIDHVRGWKNCLEIVEESIQADHKKIGEGQLLRAKKALTELTILMLNDKDVAINSVVSQRNRSFGRMRNLRNSSGGGHFRSLSWSVSRNWSASRQLLMMNANLNAPRGNEVLATNGFAVPIYMMNLVVLFVMWVLVAAIPCQDRGLSVNFSVGRGYVFSGCLVSLHEKILEESKKRERKNANGLLKEIGLIEKCMRNLNELIDNHEWPFGEEKEREIRAEVGELREVCGVLKNGLDPLERQVRELFHRIVRNRTEGLDCLARNSE